MFIKLSRVRNDFMLGGRVPEQPSLVVYRIPNEDALLNMRLKLGALVLLYKHKGSAFKNAKMRDIWLELMPEFIRHFVGRKGSRGRAIVHMGIGSNSISPEGPRKFGLIK